MKAHSLKIASKQTIGDNTTQMHSADKVAVGCKMSPPEAK